MRAWAALILAPVLALACQGAMFALVSPSCSVQTRVALHLVAAACLLATLGLAGLARRDWSRRSAVSPTPDGEGAGPVETRRFLAAAGTAVALLSSLVVLMMWVAAWVLSPLLVGLLAATPALAHAPDAAHAAAPVAAQWNLTPWLLAVLLLSGAGYALGVRKLWTSAGRGRGLGTGAVLAFAAGWLSLVVALVSPLDSLGSQLFSAHMVQHEVLMVIAAPLLVLGRPLAAWTWAFERPARQRIGKAFQAAGWLAFWGLLTDPIVAWGLHAIALWAWHIPALFDAALRNEAVHDLQHVSFLGSALLFWWTALGGDPRQPRGAGIAVASLFTTMLHTAALGALLSLAPTPWYAPYIATSNALGIDPVEDQQLGGLVMWVPAGLAYVVAALALLGRLLVRQRA